MKRTNLKLIKKCVKIAIIAFVFILICYIVMIKLTEVSFENFQYPLDVDMPKLVHEYRLKGYVNYIEQFVYPFHAVVQPSCKRQHNGLNLKVNCSIPSVFLLILVKSATGNFHRRNAVRKTWGDDSLLQDTFPKMRVFLIGQSKNRKENNMILEEAKKYNDILFLSYFDSYENNTYKTIGGLNWAVGKCNRSKYIMFVDDDFYVNPVLITRYLNSLSAEDSRHLFMGRVWHTSPHRCPVNKWYVPVSEYPYDRYPPFISAGCMIMSMEFAIDVSIAVKYTAMFRMDDVYLAIVVYKLKVKPVHHDKINIGFKTHVWSTYTIVKEMIASHNFADHKKLIEAWEIFKSLKY